MFFFFFQPLQQAEWFGNARGYNVSFKGMFVGNGGQEREIFPYTLTIEDPTSNSYILDNLEEYTQYEIVMIAFNDVGFSQPSPPAIERTKESGMFTVKLFWAFFSGLENIK